MKKILAALTLAVGFVLSGCATTASIPAGAVTASPTAALTTFYNRCVDYNAALRLTTALGQYLTTPEIQQVSLISHTITPICEAPPANPVAATQQVTAALTRLAIYEAIEASALKGAKKP